MSNKLKQIAAILANYDVRDPRAALRAIEQVLVAKVSKGAKPVAVIKVFDNPESKSALKCGVEIRFSRSRVEPRHLNAALAGITQFGDNLFGSSECNEPDCPAHGAEAGVDSFIKDQLEKLAKNKGQLQ